MHAHTLPLGAIVNTLSHYCLDISGMMNLMLCIYLSFYIWSTNSTLSHYIIMSIHETYVWNHASHLWTCTLHLSIHIYINTYTCLHSHHCMPLLIIYASEFLSLMYVIFAYCILYRRLPFLLLWNWLPSAISPKAHQFSLHSLKLVFGEGSFPRSPRFPWARYGIKVLSVIG